MQDETLGLDLTGTGDAPDTEALILGLAPDQQDAFGKVALVLRQGGIDIEAKEPVDRLPHSQRGAAMAILGRAGSGKTHLLALIVKRILDCGTVQVTSDSDPKDKHTRRSFAVVAPTNKAASVLSRRGVEATTIHRIIYSPVYDPKYQKIIDWFGAPGAKDKPDDVPGVTSEALDRALAFYKDTRSAPGAMAIIGLRGAEFITGWKRREGTLDIGLVDEASMLDDQQMEDLRKIFDTLVLFGDPAQLAPIMQSGAMSFDKLPAPAKLTLERNHRQSADNPIVDLAYMLGQDDVTFAHFTDAVKQAASRDERVVVAERASADLMVHSPVLVWTNNTRIRLIHAFRKAHNCPADALKPGEPLICDGIELPARQRKSRISLEQAGLIKGAQVTYRGEGRKPGFARLYIHGVPDPQISAASIIQIERPGEEESLIASAARMGALFLHGSAVTIHKAQGSQWPDVQLFAPDIAIAARTGRMEAGIPLWKRLAYVAITRAEERLFWVTQNRLARPTEPLENNQA